MFCCYFVSTISNNLPLNLHSSILKQGGYISRNKGRNVFLSSPYFKLVCSDRFFSAKNSQTAKERNFFFYLPPPTYSEVKNFTRECDRLKKIILKILNCLGRRQDEKWNFCGIRG